MFFVLAFGRIWNYFEAGPADMAANELSVLELVSATFMNYKSKEMIDYMHKEKAYTDTMPNQVIPYSLAKQLNELR